MCIHTRYGVVYIVAKLCLQKYKMSFANKKTFVN